MPAAHLVAAYPARRANASVIVRAHGLGPNDTLLEIFVAFGAVLSIPLTVFAIGCANVINLQLARAAERARELAVRLSMGASRWQFIRLLTLETMALAASAVAVSSVATMTILQFSDSILPINASIDWRVAAFSFVLMMTVTFSIAPNTSPLGRMLQVEDSSGNRRNIEIVGVVDDNPTRPMQIGGRPQPVVYVALPRDFSGPFTLRIRTQSREVVPVVSAALREILRDVNPRLPWLSLRSGEESYLSEAPALRYLAMSIAGLGILALLLAATGLYAVMSYVVLLRRREIGIRVAIGAGPRQIMTMMVRQAFRLVLTGGAIGLGLAIPLAFGLRAVWSTSAAGQACSRGLQPAFGFRTLCSWRTWNAGGYTTT